MSESPPASEITEVDFGDGDVALSVELLIPPFGEAIFTADDTSSASRETLQALREAWSTLWPVILDKLEEGIVDFQLPRKLEVDEFIGLVSRVEEDDEMAARSDIYLSLEFDQEPHWDFYIRGSRIVHSQPVL